MTVHTPSRLAAAGGLRDGGTVLDVGCGAGAASLPLADRAARIVGVDSSGEMLAAFAAGANRLGLDHDEICGEWPTVAGSVPSADVVVCHHVVYNVAALVPFVSALNSHARRRVVLEITDLHPQSALNDLWLHFHGLLRPDAPTAEVVIDVLREEGLEVHVERFSNPDRLTARDPVEAAAFARRRLCLPLEREPEVAELLLGLDESAPSQLVTIWWTPLRETKDPAPTSRGTPNMVADAQPKSPTTVMGD